MKALHIQLYVCVLVIYDTLFIVSRFPTECACIWMCVPQRSRHFTSLECKVYMGSFTALAQRGNNQILFPEVPLGQLLFN